MTAIRVERGRMERTESVKRNLVPDAELFHTVTPHLNVQRSMSRWHVQGNVKKTFILGFLALLYMRVFTTSMHEHGTRSYEMTHLLRRETCSGRKLREVVYLQQPGLGMRSLTHFGLKGDAM